MKKRFWCGKHTTISVPPERCRDCMTERIEILERSEHLYQDALIRIIALHDRRDLLDAQMIAEEALARGVATTGDGAK